MRSESLPPVLKPAKSLRGDATASKEDLPALVADKGEGKIKEEKKRSKIFTALKIFWKVSRVWGNGKWE